MKFGMWYLLDTIFQTILWLNVTGILHQLVGRIGADIGLVLILIGWGYSLICFTLLAPWEK